MTGGGRHTIARIEAFAFRHPIDRPVETSFGRMTDRPAVFLRVEASDGAFGWGEVFANWPAAGAEHRVNLLERDIAPLIVGATVGAPEEVFDSLTQKTRIRALQCGEWGPFRQVIAGIDAALWDLKARAVGLPLRKLLNPDAADYMPAYASGIAIAAAAAEVPAARAAGFRAFKVKVGFDLDRDLRLLRDLAGTLQPGERLLTDANQAFDTATARRFLQATEDMGLGWLEEPIPADAPTEDWAALAASSQTPLAGGENIAGEEAFDDAIRAGHLHFIQPDLAKWGGVTGCLRVARAALAAGRVYCPHFLGGAIGLSASAELLAAVGGDGMLEVDVNPNPLRDAFGLPGMDPATGLWSATPDAGVGVETLPELLRPMLTHAACVTG
ncbi:mandelate racemase/muconate lactonizing enzyme family protein [Aestuariicoccus sp. MJ-SS9]|uniref:mandelate racemase/muconate lactonizing enzyme family protein n=1 Tax=Aestuariicoccus sp. MJ-SS9 TaxID=3079855 RepID=UPI00290C6A04|nr:mandelate racemase/muconate lactonizing enzyme family protein [Aestuariicoccus sp. MJ-SS9]MDU8913169.1 mandelate racemase/muconate lactonizing enzyme family protein [Aestuariicoccus sp. MJ-SS9]